MPGNINTVHHVLLYRMTTSSGDSLAVQKDAAEVGEGYGPGGPGLPEKTMSLRVDGHRVRARSFFQTIGIEIAPNHKMVMQLHYNSRTPTSDKTALRLKLVPP